MGLRVGVERHVCLACIAESKQDPSINESYSLIKMCRVQWSHHSEAEATWEREDELRKTYPDLFASQPSSISGRDFFKGVGSVTP